MKVVYEPSVEDSLFVSVYATSPVRRALFRWVVPAALAAYLITGTFWGGGEEEGTASLLIGNIIVGLLLFAGWRLFISWFERSARKRLASQGTGAGTRHNLELTDNSLVQRNEVSCSTYTLDAVQRIVRRPKHTLIYVGQGIIVFIPHQGILVGDIDGLVAALTAATGLASQ